MIFYTILTLAVISWLAVLWMSARSQCVRLGAMLAAKDREIAQLRNPR